MLFNLRLQTTSRPVIAALLVLVVVLGAARIAGAFASGNSSSTASFGKGTCAFSLQLQQSVTLRRQYLVKVGDPLGSFAANNAIEEMYGNIKPAAYESPVASEGRGRTYEAFSFGGKKAAQVVNIDPLSADCVSCHDGVSASSIAVDLRNRPFERTSRVNSFTNDHPIGMDYASYLIGNKALKPIRGNSKMIFVNGKVGCITCHDPLNEEKGHLVMSDVKSALCLTCHNK
jgi:predicted CXXCH cytochrome family protein